MMTKQSSWGLISCARMKMENAILLLSVLCPVGNTMEKLQIVGKKQVY